MNYGKRAGNKRRRALMLDENGQLVSKPKNKMKKPAIVVLAIIAGVMVLMLAAVLLIFSYIWKINYDQGKYETVATIPAETEQQAGPDSDQAAIDALEEQMRAQSEVLTDDAVTNILLIGVDARTKGERCRSDSMILVSINEDTRKIVMTSLLRDSYVSIPGVGHDRLNAAHAYGGPDLLMRTIEYNFGIGVDRYVSVDFSSFVDVVDAAGGLELTISDAEREVANRYIYEINRIRGVDGNSNMITSSGYQHVNGTQALGYARIRYVGNGDFQRTDRQREVLDELFNKMKKLNILELNDLLNVMLPNLTTNLTQGQLFSLVLGMPTYRYYKVDSYHVPFDGAYSNMTIRGMAVLGLDFDQCIAEMKRRIYNIE